MTLPIKTLLGAILGVLFGILFGKYAAYLRPIGSLYVLLLQVAVFPYLISSLLRSLGGLVPTVAANLLKRGWLLYLLLIAITFVVMILLCFAIPISESSISLNQTDTHLSVISTLLNLLIPANPFAALSQNYVPAIIIFCVLYGVMIQHVKHKKSLLEILDTISAASLEFWRKLVVVAPYAVFALFADTAGTINISELRELSVYLFVFFLGTFLLAFWIIPAVVSSLTPLKQKDIVSGMREGLMLSISTTLSVVALPFIQEFTKKLIQSEGIKNEESDEIIQTVSSVSYAFAQLGNCFLYVFAIFAAYYLSRPLDATQQLLLPFMSYLSSIGSPSATVSSVTFLSQWLHLPDAASELYVSTLALTRYGQVVASVMGIAGLTILMTTAYYRKLKIQLPKLIFNLVLVFILLVAFALTARHLQPLIFNNAAANLATFQLAPELTKDVTVTMLPSNNSSTQSNEDSLARIQRTHILRVGYNPNVIPFCYFNSKHELVGYDVAMVYALAKTLQAQIQFIPFSWNNVITDLNQNKFDIAIGGLYASQDRLSAINLSDPYFSSSLAFIVPENKKHAYEDLNQDTKQTLKVAIFDDPVLRVLAKHYFSDASVVVLPNYEDLVQLEKTQQVDVALWTEEQAEAWVMVNPGFAAIAPKEVFAGSALPFAYFVPKNSPQFLSFLNYWLKLKKLDQFEEQQRKQWLYAEVVTKPKPRWNIIDEFRS